MKRFFMRLMYPENGRDCAVGIVVTVFVFGILILLERKFLPDSILGENIEVLLWFVGTASVLAYLFIYYLNYEPKQKNPRAGEGPPSTPP